MSYCYLHVLVTASIKLLEELFQNTFEEYSQIIISTTGSDSDSDNSIKFHRAMNYTLPSTLAAHVDSVMLVADFPPVNRKPIQLTRVPSNMRGSDASHLHFTAASGFVSPSLLNTFYNINNNTGSTAVSQCVYETLGQSFSPSDLLAFQTLFGLPRKTISNSIGTVVMSCNIFG